jgi:transcriptional antiterminator RfaH
MQTHASEPFKPTPKTLTAAQVADRMGLTTRQLQDLRLRGVGPQIVQQGLSVHYELAEIREIERHEAVAVMDQVLASERPLTLLRALVDLAGFKPSPILQHVSKGATPATPAQQPTLMGPAASSAALLNFACSAVDTDAAATGSASTPPPVTGQSATMRHEATAGPANPQRTPILEPQAAAATAVTLSVIKSPATAWYLVHTKPRQEDVALANLERQGYECYLPQMRIERIRRRKAEVATEPMFPRYLFIRLDSSDQGKSWSPIRSTLGVSQLVHFGARAAKVDDALIDLLRQREQAMPLDSMFHSGDSVVVADGPFTGIEAIYQTADAERRAFILLEILSKPVSMQIDTGRLRKAG